MFGSETSARNSEVIHAGLHYARQPLKARLCVAGRHALYAYCAARGIAHRRCGKLIVASSAAQLRELAALRAQGEAAGVDDLVLLDAAEARALEPELVCAGAIFSPSTGIVDSHALMHALLGDAERAGAVLAVNSPVLGGTITAAGIELVVGGDAPTTIRARRVVNAAGHGALPLAAALGGLPQHLLPAAQRAKGSYFALAGRAPFAHLVYPLPAAGGLGVHLTLDLGGQARFGPDVEWLAADAPFDYRVDPARADGFYAAIRRYWPALADGALTPAFAGIRPKISGPGDAAADFAIHGREIHGIDGLVQLFGIESPGLTASLAIAEHVCALLLPEGKHAREN